MDMRDIIWDMGGTLLDTYPALDRVLCEATHGVEGVTPERLHEVATLTRNSTASAIRTLAARYDVPAERLHDAEAALKHQWESEPAPLMDGALDVFRAVHDAGRVNLVVTHRDRGSAGALLSGHGLVVDDMICAPDGYARKPDPQMYRVILERNHVLPSTALGIGDRPIDAVAARAAGVEPLLLVTPGLPVEDDGTPRITSLRDLLPGGRASLDS